MTDILDEVKRISTSLELYHGVLMIFTCWKLSNALISCNSTYLHARELNILSIEKDCSGMFSGAHFDGRLITIDAHTLVIGLYVYKNNLKVEFKNCYYSKCGEQTFCWFGD